MDLTEQYGKLPWRGPEIPVLHDSGEEQKPVDGLTVKVELLEMSNPEHRNLYASVYNRQQAGYAVVLGEKIAESGTGFRVLLIWGERYQCGPGFVAEEAKPILRSNEYPNPAFVGEDVRCQQPAFGTPVPLKIPLPVTESAPIPIFQSPLTPVKLMTRELEVKDADPS
jgi:hypothetical protein